MSVTLSQLQDSGVLALGFRFTARVWLPCSWQPIPPAALCGVVSCVRLPFSCVPAPLGSQLFQSPETTGFLQWCFTKVKFFFLCLKFFFLISGFSWLLANSTEKGKSKAVFFFFKNSLTPKPDSCKNTGPKS